MYRCSSIIVIFAIVTGGYGFIVSLVEVLLGNGGHWILAAAASTNVPPPYKSCVNMTVTLLPYKSDCIISNLNLTSRMVRNVQIHRTSQDNDTEIWTRGPIHEFMIKRRNEKGEEDKVLKEIREKKVLWEAIVNQAICWRPQSRPRKFVTYRYVITPVDNTLDAVYIVGIKQRIPVPEYEVSILTKGILRRDKVQRMVDIMNWKNYDTMTGCREKIKQWLAVPEFPLPWFWNNFIYCLPRLLIKCAEGYDMRDLSDPLNHKTPHEVFNDYVRSFKASSETESINVLHNK